MLWDIEHYFGVMMLYDRVVKLGGADTSFLTWIAEEDLEKKSQSININDYGKNHHILRW